MNDAFGVDRGAIAKATKEQKQGEAMAAAGAASIGVGTAQNPIGQAAAKRRGKRLTGELDTARADLGAARSQKVSPPPGKTWAQHGASQGLTGGAARRQALKPRKMAIKEAAGRAQKAREGLNDLPKFSRRVSERTLVGGIAIGAPLAYYGARRSAVQKRYTKKDVDAAAIGAGSGAAVYHGVSYGSKPYEKKHINAKTNADPAKKAKYDWHKGKYGITNKTPAGDPAWHKMFRNYPRDLPGARMKRVMALTHGGKTGLAVQGAAVTGAGLAAVHIARNRREDMSKSAFGVEHIEKGAKTEAFRVGTFHGAVGAFKSKKSRAGASRAYKAGHFVGRHPEAVGATAGGVLGAGVGAAINEPVRRVRNKRSGVHVTVKEQYLHPYKANAKWTNGSEERKKAVSKSAFGVEHSEIEKFDFQPLAMGAKKLVTPVADAAKGVKGGTMGASFGSKAIPSSTGGQLGGAAGAKLRAGIKSPNFKPAAIGAGSGAVAGGGAMAFRDRNRG